MNALIQFILKLFGLGDKATIERLVREVLLKKVLGGGDGNPLERLMNQFKDKGLGDIFASWVGTGKNAAATPDEIKNGVGHERMEEMSKKTGLSVNELAEKLARYLPGLVDKMTPGGKLPG